MSSSPNNSSSGGGGRTSGLVRTVRRSISSVQSGVASGLTPYDGPEKQPDQFELQMAAARKTAQARQDAAAAQQSLSPSQQRSLQIPHSYTSPNLGEIEDEDHEDPLAERRCSELLGGMPVTFEGMKREYKQHNFPMTKSQYENHWKRLKLEDKRRAAIAENRDVTFEEMKGYCKSHNMPFAERDLKKLWDSYPSAERRVAPILDGRAPVYEEYVALFKRKGFPMTKSQLERAWMNLNGNVLEKCVWECAGEGGEVVVIIGEAGRAVEVEGP